MDQPEPSERVSRRDALKIATGGFVPLVGIDVFGSVNSKGSEFVDVPIERTIIDGEVKFLTKKLPKGWVDYENKVEKAQEDFNRKFRDNKHVSSASIINNADDKRKGGKIVSQLKTYLDGEYDASKIPDEISGIPVQTDRKQEFSSRDACHQDNYSDMQGATAAHFDADADGSPDSGWGTTCCRVANPDGNCNQYMLTANHLFLSGNDCEGNWDDEMYDVDDNLYGEVYKYDQKRDFAIVDPYNESDINDHILNSEHDYPVNTNKTKSGLKDMKSDKIEFPAMGASTGEELGRIKEIDIHDQRNCTDYKKAIKTTHFGAGGDSGAPMYVESSVLDSTYSMVAMEVAGAADETACDNPGGDPTVGTPAYVMVNEMGIEFDDVC